MRRCRRFIAVIAFAAILTLLNFQKSSAATIYQRSPAGNNIENPVLISFSFDNPADFGCFPDINFWQIVVSFEDATFAGGLIRPISELNGQDQFTLPFLIYDPIDIYGAINNITYENGVLIPDCGATVGPGFTVTKPSSGGFIAHTPAISLLNIAAGQYIAGIQPIKYSAFDEDEKNKTSEHGLKQNPVNLYYSPPRSFDWFFIAKDLAASGTVLWDASKLPDGDDYRIKATVTGADNDFNQTIIEGLTIDNTPPHFSIAANPIFTKGEPIKLEIESSEILKEKPALAIAQFNREPIKIKLEGDVLTRKFYGTYEIITGFDGPAEIKISGEDLAGNKSGNMIGDASFAVGVKPPPPPQIEMPDKKLRTAERAIPLIKGFALNAEKTILKINGYSKLIETKNNNGYFQFENIGLDPKFNKGLNILSVISQDQKGRKSEPVRFEIFVNSPPEIFWLEPKSLFAGLNGVIKLSWAASDINNDALSYQIELSYNRGQTWKTIIKDLKETEFMWDSSSAPDGSNYIFKITASDGSLKSSSLSKKFGIANDLPAIILETGGDFFTNEASRIFKGLVRSKKDLLNKLEYSADDGKNWNEITPEDQKWDSQFERFNFKIPALKKGAQNIIVRGTTASGRLVINYQNLKVVFDNAAPDLKTEILPKTPVAKKFLAINGFASDDDSGIKEIEYSIDGSGWYKTAVDKTGAKTTEFKIKHPEPLKDGPHQIQTKAVDFAGNASEIKTQSMVIDATSPRFGSFMLEANGKIIYPKMEKLFRIKTGAKLKLTMAVSEQPKTMRLTLDNAEIPLKLNAEKDLWESELEFKNEGWFVLKASAEDGLGNKNEKELARIQAVNQVIEK